MTDTKRRFTVISNENFAEEKTEKKVNIYYQTNPIKWQSQSLREDFMRYTNNEAGPRFSIEDLL